jgi:hypothetical protein
MSPKDEFDTGYELGEHLELATAITDRDFKEIEFGDAVTRGNDVEYESYGVKSEGYKDAAIAMAAQNVARIENPDYQINMQDFLDARYGDLYEGIAVDLSGKQGRVVSIDEARQIIYENHSQVSEDIGQSAEQQTEDFKTIFAAAKKIAKIHGVPVAQVYRSDELYAEAHREAYTPERVAWRYIRVIDGFVKSMTTQDIAIEEEIATLDQSDYDLVMLEREMNSEVHTKIAVEKADIVRTIQDLAFAYIQRFWGPEGIDALSDEAKLKIGI